MVNGVITYDGDGTGTVEDNLKFLGGQGSSGRKYNLELSGSLQYEMPTPLTEFTGEVVNFGSLQNAVDAGDLVYLNSTVGGNQWQKVSNQSAAATKMLGIALGTTIDDGILVRGYADSTEYGNFSDAARVYISSTAGEMTTTIPTTSGQYVRILGYCIIDTSAAKQRKTIYFNPDNTYILL